MTAWPDVALAFLVSLPVWGEPPTLTVCEVLDQLSGLAGQEVRVRGVWLFGDSLDILWASPDCGHPTVRDGWVWGNAIDIAPDHPRRFASIYKQRQELGSGSEPLKIVVTLTGRLDAKEHFRMNRFSGLPVGYGDCAAGLIFSKVEDLQAAPFEAAELKRFEAWAVSPQPTRLKRKKKR